MATSDNGKNNNDNRTLITAVAVLVALAAVTYALVTKSGPSDTVVTTPVATQTYEINNDNPVVLAINGKEVTRQEIIDNFKQSNSNLPEDIDLQQIFPLLQDQYIIGELLEQAARDEGITVNDPEVAEQLRQAQKQALRAAYIKKVGEEGLSEGELRQAYDDIIGNSPDTQERHARHILVEDEEKARELITRLNEGANFEELAKTESIAPEGANGGDLGYFAKNEMVPTFAEAAFAMNPGEISQEPVQTNFGWHVIKLEDVRMREKPSFDEVREQLVQQLRQGVIGAKLQELREESEITVYSFAGEPIENAVTEDAVIAPQSEVVPVPVTPETTTQQPETLPETEIAPVTPESTMTEGETTTETPEQE